jgi:hypothetical protein
MTDTVPPPQVWPTLRARDARGLIRFLVDAFGFEETAVYGGGDLVEHAQLSWPPAPGLACGQHPDWVSPPATRMGESGCTNGSREGYPCGGTRPGRPSSESAGLEGEWPEGPERLRLRSR